MSREVSDIAFEPDGTCHVTFLETTDIRCEGAVARRQTIRIAPTDQYADGIQDVADAVGRLLKDALADWSVSEPADVEVGAPVPTERALEDGLVYESQPGEDDEAVARRNWEAIERAREA